MFEKIKKRKDLSEQSNPELYNRAEEAAEKVNQSERELQVITEEIQRRLGLVVMGEIGLNES